MVWPRRLLFLSKIRFDEPVKEVVGDDSGMGWIASTSLEWSWLVCMEDSVLNKRKVLGLFQH